MICVSVGIICVILFGICIYSIVIKSASQKKSDIEIGGKYSKESSLDYNSEVLSSETEDFETEIVFTGAYNSTSAISELDEIEKRRFDEAFQILPIDGLAWKDDNLADYVMLEIYRVGDDDISVLEVPGFETFEIQSIPLRA
jgi:hypothetical protein